MAGISLSKLVLNLLLIAFILLNHQYVLQQIEVEAEITLNATGQCVISPNTSGDNATTIHSTSTDTCSVRVTTTPNSAALIQVAETFSDNEVLYIERQSAATWDCPNRIIQIYGHGEPCSTALTDESFELNFQGSVSIQIREIQAPRTDQPVCGLYSMGREDSETNEPLPTCLMYEYSDIIPCDWNEKKGQCSFDFPPECNTTLGFRQVILHCLDLNQDHHVLIDYPDLLDIKDLYLKESNSIEIDVDAFKGMANLDKLRLHFNHINSLPVGIFDGLNKLTFLNLRENQLLDIPVDLFSDLHNLETLLLQWNELTQLDVNIFNNLKQLKDLKLYQNHLKEIKTGLFDGVPSLINLDLSENRLVALAGDVFRGLHNLTILLLNNNLLTSLGKGIFHNMPALSKLSLSTNMLTYLSPNLFNETQLLTYLDISYNMLHDIPTIVHLSNLNHLYLEGNSLHRINKEDFSHLHKPVEVIASQPEICECYTPSEVDCSATNPRSHYLTCERLLSDKVLSIFMWVIGINALAVNLFVLIWRRKYSAKNMIQSLLLRNLAWSDFLMGIYMIVIATADVHFGNSFPLLSETWRTGYICRFAGALCIISSEASVLFITLISMNRFISIKYPQISLKSNKKSVIALLLFTWIFALAAGLIPSMLDGINDKFYDNSHVCIGIPLTLLQVHNTTSFEKEIKFEKHFQFDVTIVKTQLIGQENGMYFSAAIFLGLNSLCFITTLACYMGLLQVVFKYTKWGGNMASLDDEMKTQLRLTAKVIGIVATDFLCWSPIIALGILVQTRVITLPPSVYAWSVTVVLPLNSAINPYLYTIADIVYRPRKSTGTLELGSMTLGSNAELVPTDQPQVTPASMQYMIVQKPEKLPSTNNIIVDGESGDVYTRNASTSLNKD